jgi:hypothetical protein
MKNQSSLWIVVASLVSLSCAKPVVFSGGDLPENQRAVFAGGSGIEVHHIDGVEVDGRLFILAPGTYAIQFASTLDMKKANPMLKGILNIADCKTEIQLDPGEELVLSSRLKMKSDAILLSNIEHTIKLKSSSNDEHSRTLGHGECVETINCDRADRLQLVAAGCE